MDASFRFTNVGDVHTKIVIEMITTEVLNGFLRLESEESRKNIRGWDAVASIESSIEKDIEKCLCDPASSNG